MATIDIDCRGLTPEMVEAVFSQVREDLLAKPRTFMDIVHRHEFITDDTFHWRPGFDRDMQTAMIRVGQGHDPYNHVGHKVVAECIGA